jgi:type IV secretory pathway VirB4 component
MLNLSEYRKKPVSLADYLPWVCLIAPGVILNKGGSFMAVARYRGPDLDSATDVELAAIPARLNNVLKRFGSRWGCSSRLTAFLRAIIPAAASPILSPGSPARSGNRLLRRT